jgi:hypothetical protein
MEFIDTELQHKCSPEAFTKGVTHSLNKEDETHTKSTPKAAPHLMPLKSLQSLPGAPATGAPATGTPATDTPATGAPATGTTVTVSNKSSTMVSIVKVMIILIVVGVVIYGMVKIFKTWSSLSSLPVLSLLLWPLSIFSRLGQGIGIGWLRLGA